MTSLIGQQLQDRYQLKYLLGHRTGRRTFLATDLQTKSQVVLKLILFSPDFTWEDLKLFRRESDTLKRLNHPVIPKYLDSFEVETDLGKGFALVQSHTKAKSLQAWANEGGCFSHEELRSIAAQLLAILEYLHNHQPPVIHRDIKPSNILLGDSRTGNYPGKIHLIDFGSVHTTQPVGKTITVLGTYGYMPPEQFGGKSSPASDLYSLGATLVYLITRQHPADLPLRKGQIHFSVASQTSAHFQVWLKYLTNPVLTRRPQSAQQAVAAFQHEALTPPPDGIQCGKPDESEISLVSTKEQIKITIPSRISHRRTGLKYKLSPFAYAAYLSSVPLLLLLVALNFPGFGWFLAAIFGCVAGSIWVRAIYVTFATIELIVDADTITRSVRWLGRIQSASSPSRDITAIRTTRIVHTQKEDVEVSALDIWAGNRSYSLARLTMNSNAWMLQRPEMDWLASELSDWLDLPVTRDDRKREEIMGMPQEKTKAVFI